MKKAASILLSLVILFSALPLTAFAGAHTHSWDMDHVRWIIDADENGVNSATATFVCLDDYSHELVKTYSIRAVSPKGRVISIIRRA